MARLDFQLNALSQLINRALALDPQAKNHLSVLSGQAIRLECSEPALNILIRINQNAQLQLSQNPIGQADTHLRGPLSAFIQLFSQQDKASAMMNSGLQLKGNSQPLVDLADSLEKIDIDWEYHLSQIIGELPAHLLGTISRRGRTWLDNNQPVFLRHLQEFIIEEANLCPHTDEVEQFINDVQAIKLRTERLEAKIKRLQQEKPL